MNLDTAGAVVINVVISLVLLLSAAWCWYQWTHRRLLTFARSRPTLLPTLPLIGNLHQIFFGKNVPEDVLLNVFLSRPPNKNTSCIWFGPVPVVFLSRVSDIKKFLTSSKTLHKSAEYNVAKFAIEDALITAPVHLWKKTRRQIDPMFHARNLELLVPSLNESSRQLVRSLSDREGQGQFDILEDIALLSFKNIFDFLFGPDRQHRTTNWNVPLELSDVIMFAAAQRIHNIWLRWDCVFKFVYYSSLNKLKLSWEETPERKLLGTQAVHKQSVTTVHEDPEHTNRDKNDGKRQLLTLTTVLQSLRNTDPHFNDKYAREEVFSFLGAGSETVSITLSSCFVALAAHSQIQDKVYNEIIEVVGTDTVISMQDLKAMKYLDQVVRETMRRFYVIPIIARRSEDEIELSDCTLPPNTTTVISIGGLHMDPDIYPDPDKFDPERFSPENIAKREQYAFLPFSGGPRNCVGKRFAMLSMKITIASVLREFSLHTDVNIDDIKFKFRITLSSASGYPVALKKR